MAVIPFVVRRISELLGRDLDSEHSTVGARDAVLAALGADRAA